MWLTNLWPRYLAVTVVVTLPDCTTSGYVMWLQNLWSHYLGVQVVVMLRGWRTSGYVIWLELMVTLTGCTSYGYVIWLHKLWSHLTAQLVVTLCGCRIYGYVMWLQNLRLLYVAAELLVTLCDFRTYGYVMRLQNFWSRYLTAQLPYISSKKSPSYFRLKSLTWTDKQHEIKVPLQKLTVHQLLKIFPEFYRIRSSNSKFVKARHWSLSWSRLVRSTTSHIVSLRPNLTLRKGKSVGHLKRRYLLFGSHKIRRISWLSENRLAVPGLCSME
jgi:hypothetical protein